MSALPLFYYPASVVWVDDDELLLNAATEFFGNDVKVETFNSAEACLDFFENYTSILSEISLLSGCGDYEEYDTINHSPVDINTQALRQLPDQLERKNEVCVLIVDYRMHGMTGIELCRKLKSLSAKKILLTGDADSELAVAAFNEGIIDCYIRKDSSMLAAEIMNYLSTLSIEYFNDIGKTLLAHLETDRKIPFTDPIFVEFFMEWRKENRIKEHFIFDKQGNMQLIDDEGNRSLFIVHTDKTLNEFVELYASEKEILNYVEIVKNRTKVPFFGIGLESWQHEVKDWSEYFYTPEVLSGREKYYWFTKKYELS